MAKRVASRSVESHVSKLAMRLHAPGMSTLHRAGLGGLACTLAQLERQVQGQMVSDDLVPGAPWQGGIPPWHVDSERVTLRFGEPTEAGEFLRRLFEYAFDLVDGLIFLPGQYGQNPPSREVRAYLQQGYTLTFLQHGKSRTLAKKETPFSYEVDGKMLTIEYKSCSTYKHRNGWEDFVNTKGGLRTNALQVVGPVNPGAVVRHNAFAAQTKIEEPPSHLLPLYFALVGAIALPVNRGSGVLLVPNVDDLQEFIALRPWMTPSSVRECRIVSPCDAALQLQVRLLAKRVVEENSLPACLAARFQSTPWASQQKSRVNALEVPPGEDATLDLYATVLQIPELAPRAVSREIVETKGRGRNKKTIKREETFWVDSIVRPLIAENIACGRPWYEGFVSLLRDIDPVSKKPKREKLVFERKGLHAMTETVPWKSIGEATLVKAVQEALGRRYGRIADENKSNLAAMKSRWRSEYDKWRLAFSGTKTVDQFRRALCDLFSRAPGPGALRGQWEEILPMLQPDSWQLARDLALLGLASYAGTGADQVSNESTEEKKNASGN